MQKITGTRRPACDANKNKWLISGLSTLSILLHADFHWPRRLNTSPNICLKKDWPKGYIKILILNDLQTQIVRPKRLGFLDTIYLRVVG